MTTGASGAFGRAACSGRQVSTKHELFTRQGHSPGVALPRILGIEAVGVVAQAPGGEFAGGDTAAWKPTRAAARS